LPFVLFVVGFALFWGPHFVAVPPPPLSHDLLGLSIWKRFEAAFSWCSLLSIAGTLPFLVVLCAPYIDYSYFRRLRTVILVAPLLLTVSSLLARLSAMLTTVTITRVDLGRFPDLVQLSFLCSASPLSSGSFLFCYIHVFHNPTAGVCSAAYVVVLLVPCLSCPRTRPASFLFFFSCGRAPPPTPLLPPC